MATLLTYPEEKLPAQLKKKILAVLHTEWPAVVNEEMSRPLHDPNSEPIYLVLVEGETVLSYLAIPSKLIEHAGETYKAYGLSAVITNVRYRRQGYGRQIVDAATAYIKASDADIGVFTCDPPLVGFYAQSGWTVMENTPVIGGTRAQPFPSDSLNKCTLMGFFSEKALQHQSLFKGVPIHLELREGDLW